MSMSATQTEGDTTASDSVAYVPGKVTTQYEECGGPVRWRKGVLEQMWIVTGIGTTGAVETREHVWRPVPEASNDD